MKILTPFLFVASLFLAAFVSPVCLYAQTPEHPVGDFSELSDTDSGIVSEIINPLTVRLEDGRTIYLTGLDYPDLDYYTPGSLSVTAQDILKDMLVGKKVSLYQSQDAQEGRINRMGQILAHMEISDSKLWVQGTMISLGLARARTTKTNPEMAAQMYAEEEKARTENIGLWQIVAFQIHTSDDAGLHIGGFHIVEGTIRKVSLKQNRIYLNFGGNWKTDFTVSIAPDAKRLFRKSGLDPQNMGGHKVRVRGWLDSYNGPYIEINHPESLEVLATSNAAPASDTPEAEATQEAETLDGSALPAASEDAEEDTPRLTEEKD